MRAEDIFYAAALAIWMAWLVFSSGALAPQSARTPPDTLGPRTAPAAVSAPSLPRVAAEVTLDTERFYILVGDGPPSFGVAVSAGDPPGLDPLGR